MHSANFIQLLSFWLEKVLPMEFLDHIVFRNSIRNYLLFLIILLLGLIFKRIFSRILSRIIFKIFNQKGSNSSVQVFISLLLRPIEWLIMSVASYIAIYRLDYPLKAVIFSQERIHNKVATYFEIRVNEVIDTIFYSLLIFTSLWIVLRLIDSIAYVFSRKASLTQSKMDDQMVPFIKELSKIVAIIIAIFIALKYICDVNVAAIITGLGIGGLAIALAAKDTLQNLLGSLTIFADKPFVAGDLIRVDKYEGTIEKVGFRSTLLRTTDKTVVVIPNAKMIDTPLENLTLRNLRRVKFYINLPYDTQPKTMKAISSGITSYINRHRYASDAFVHFESIAESSFNLLVRYYIGVTDDNAYLNVREEINYQIIDIVNQNDAQLALPAKNIHLKQRSDPDQHV